MKEMKELLLEFIEWARNCGEDAFFIFDEPKEAVDRFTEYKSFTDVEE